MPHASCCKMVSTAGPTACHFCCYNTLNALPITRDAGAKIHVLLARAGADVQACTRAGGATALHRAAFMGHTSMVELL